MVAEKCLKSIEIDEQSLKIDEKSKTRHRSKDPSFPEHDVLPAPSSCDPIQLIQPIPGE